MSLRLASVLLLLPGPSLAGAWLREERKAFVSLGFSIRQPSGDADLVSRQELFAEYGMRPKLTLGLKGYMDSDLSGMAEVFARFPIRAGDRPGRISAEFGLGAQVDAVGLRPHVRTAVSWGRSIKLGERNGWINVDAAVEWPVGALVEEPLFKLDATFGLDVSDRGQIMVQAFFEADETDSAVTLAPSFIFRRPSGVKYVIGFEHKTGDAGHTGLRFGLWREF